MPSVALVRREPLAPRWRAWSLEPPARRRDARRRGSCSRTRARATWRSRGEDGRAARRTTGSTRSGTRSSGTAPGRRSRGRSRPGEHVELDVRGHAPRARPAATARVRPRRGAPLLVRRGRRHAARARDRRRAAHRRAPPRGRGPRRRRIQRRPPRSRRRRRRSSTSAPPRRRISSRARCRRRTGRACLLDAHAEGWAAVGTAPDRGRERRARARALARAPGGRNPRFDRPLLLPSLLDGIEPRAPRAPGLRRRRRPVRRPAVVTLPRRSGRRPTLNTSAPSGERDDRLDEEVDRVAGRGHLAREERRPEALDRRGQSDGDESRSGPQSVPTPINRTRGERHDRYLHLRRLFQPRRLRRRQRQLDRLLG